MLDIMEAAPSSSLPPWEGLGTSLDQTSNVDGWLRQSGLDWKVNKLKQFVEYPGYKGRSLHRIPTGSEALVKCERGVVPGEDEVLTILPTHSWNPVQNAAAMEFFKKFTESGRVRLEAAGALMGGRHVWAIGELVDQVDSISPGDFVTGNLLFSNPHQFGYSMDVRLMPIRKIGMSTLVIPMAGSKKINHRKLFTAGQIEHVIDKGVAEFGEFIRSARALAAAKYTPKQAISYLNKVFPKTSDRRGDHSTDDVCHSKAARAAYEMLETQPGASLRPNSMWNCFTAVAYLIDHRLGKGKNTRLYSAWYGVNQDVKIKAFKEACL